MNQITKNFHRKEFDCKDGTEVPKIYKNNVIKVAANLQVIRDFFDKPIIINSAYRTLAHNNKVKGSPTSQHLTAKAVDIRINGITPVTLYHLLEWLIYTKKIDEGGLLLYNTFVHYDIRGYKARANYSTLYRI